MPHLNAGNILLALRRLAGTGLVESSDAGLLNRFVAGGDELAFQEILRRHGPTIYGLCRRLLADDHLAEDAFQATFLVLVRHARTVLKRESLGSWLYGVAYRVCLKAKTAAARRHARERKVQMMLSEQAASEPTDFQPVLDEEIARLSEHYRAPLLLCYLEGKTMEEAARLLGVSLGTVQGRVNRAREQLRRRLSQRGVALSTAAVASAVADHCAVAAVPEAVFERTALAAGHLLAGSIEATAPAVQLADAVATEIAPARLGWALSVVLSLGLLGGAWLAVRGDSRQPTAPAQPAAAQPPAAEKPATVAVDRYGDPLPPGAVARLGTLRLRHPDIRSVTFAVDGKRLISGGDGGVRLWDPTTGKETGRISLSTCVMALAYSRDGERLAVGGQDGIVRIFSAANNKEECTLTTEERNVYAVAFSPDGKLLAAAFLGNLVKVWDSHQGELLQSLQVRKGHQVHAVAFSPDGATLLAGSADGHVYQWDVATWKSHDPIKANAERVTTLAITPDGKTMITGGFDTTIRFWDRSTRKETRRLGEVKENGNGKDPLINSLALSADGKLLAAGKQRTAVVWDAATAKEKWQHRFARSSVLSVAFDPKGQTLAAASQQGIYLLDVATGKERITAEESRGYAGQLLFAPDGKTLSVVNLDDHTIRHFDTMNWQRHPMDDPKDDARWASYSPDSKTLALVLSTNVGANRRIGIWDTKTGKQRGNLLDLNPWRVKCMSRDEIACVFGDQLVFHGTDGERRRLPVARGAHEFAITSDGSTVAAGDHQSGIGLWNAGAGRRLRTFGPKAVYRALVFSPDNRILATIIERQPEELPPGTTIDRVFDVVLWEVATGQERCRLTRTGRCTREVAFSANGRLLTTIRDEERLGLWSPITGEERGQLDAGSPVATAGFSPDGRFLATGCLDSTILIWDCKRLRLKESRFAEKLDEARLKELWTDLASVDAGRAARAIGTLAANPGAVEPFLATELRRARLDAKYVLRLTKELDDERFVVRTKAFKELSDLGRQSEPSLRQALGHNPSAEVRSRIEDLLEKVADPASNSATLRLDRALEALEHLATPKARDILAELERDQAGLWLGQQAGAAVKRLNEKKEPRTK